MINITDINTPKPINNFELMNDIHISIKDLKKLAAFTLFKKKIEIHNFKKTLNKILKGANKYE